MVLILTLTDIQREVRADFAHRMVVEKSRYDTDRQRETHRWCQDRFGRSALGRAVNRDQPGFYKIEGTRFVDPDIAAFEYDRTRAWVTRYTMFYFHESDHAFEFKLRWL